MAFSRNFKAKNSKRRLTLESLEDRRVMTVNPALVGVTALRDTALTVKASPAILTSNVDKYATFLKIPALESLPGAAKTIYLDFDGDFQSSWIRTDKNQVYRNVTADSPNISADDVRKIWAQVAEDFAPFNVNVTTIEPSSFADNKALRVVIGGDMSGDLVRTFKATTTIKGDSFITDDRVNPTNNSGYAAFESFSNSQPNVVYVFSNLLKNAFSYSGEGDHRSFAQMVATTASHEAGHSFGLPHHEGLDATGATSDYDVGTDATTPIMGDNLAGDRTIWSRYTWDGKTYDAMQKLTDKLGARSDDHWDYWGFAKPLNYTGSVLRTGTASGIIEKTSDEDWFKFNSTGGQVSFKVTTPEFGNLDAKLEIWKHSPAGSATSVQLVARIDSPSDSGPFSGLGASYTTYLPQGEYFVVVGSHGGYGDVGSYKLELSQPWLAPLRNGPLYSTVIDINGVTAVTPKSTESPAVGKSANIVASEFGVKEVLTVDAAYSSLAMPVSNASLAPKPAIVGEATSAVKSLDAAFASSLSSNRLGSRLWLG